jgi:MYXO-CTERM domain-containing protein
VLPCGATAGEAPKESDIELSPSPHRARDPRDFPFAAVALAASLLSCGEVEPRALHRERGAVIGGVESVAADDGVVFIGGASVNKSCTAALIAPSVLLTALHCVSHITLAPFTCNRDGTGSGNHELGELDNPALIGVYTGAFPGSEPAAHGIKLFGTGSTSACYQDLALMVLDRELDQPLVPIRLGAPAKPGELTRVIGYGFTEDQTGGTRRVRDNVLVLDVGFDGLGSESNFTLPYTILIGEGPCQGDSGGPLLSQATGAVLGVASLGFGPCSGSAVTAAYTHAAPFESLVREALEYAGEEPLLEDPGTGGTSGAGGEAGEPGLAGHAGDLGQAGEGGAAPVGTAGRSSGSAGNAAEDSGGRGNVDAVGGRAPGNAGSSAEDAGSDGVASRGEDPVTRTNAGCSCRTSTGDRSASSLVALVFAALGHSLRRRRRRRPT